MPYLHWEEHQTWSDRQSLITELEQSNNCTHSVDRVKKHRVYSQEDTSFLRKYINHESPAHDRRTLDQSYYYNLRKPQSQNNDKVILQYTKNVPEMTSKMIMVDQLWLWVLDGNTIVTAFPRRFNRAKDQADVLDGIERHLTRGVQPAVKSIYDVVALVIEHCTGVFFQRQLPPDLAFFEFFADSIGSVRNRQAQAFELFSATSIRFKSLITESPSGEQLSTILDDLSYINEEVRLVSEIKSVINELDKIDFLSGHQQEVLAYLTRAHGRPRRSLREVCDIVEERRHAWAGIAHTAEQTYQSLRDLMDLKQRQAHVSEARSARAQVEVSTRHGRSIMLFTVVTIIFLPMSFLASLFGMNSIELNDGSKLDLSFILSILFPISIVVILFALVLAFYETLRISFILSTALRFLSRCLGFKRADRKLDVELGPLR